MKLFPRALFEDALPPLALRSQVYSLVPDRTVADLQLVRSARETFGGTPGPRSLEGSLEVPALTPSVDPTALQQASGQGRCGAGPRAW